MNEQRRLRELAPESRAPVTVESEGGLAEVIGARRRVLYRCFDHHLG